MTSKISYCWGQHQKKPTLPNVRVATEQNPSSKSSHILSDWLSWQTSINLREMDMIIWMLSMRASGTVANSNAFRYTLHSVNSGSCMGFILWNPSFCHVLSVTKWAFKNNWSMQDTKLQVLHLHSCQPDTIGSDGALNIVGLLCSHFFCAHS